MQYGTGLVFSGLIDVDQALQALPPYLVRNSGLQFSAEEKIVDEDRLESVQSQLAPLMLPGETIFAIASLKADCLPEIMWLLHVSFCALFPCWLVTSAGYSERSMIFVSTMVWLLALHLRNIFRLLLSDHGAQLLFTDQRILKLYRNGKVVALPNSAKVLALQRRNKNHFVLNVDFGRPFFRSIDKNVRLQLHPNKWSAFRNNSRS